MTDLLIPFLFTLLMPSQASVQRGIKSNISSQYPMLEPYIDDIFPKKTPMLTAKRFSSALFDTLSVCFPPPSPLFLFLVLMEIGHHFSSLSIFFPFSFGSKEVPGVSLILVGTQILFIEDRKSYIPTLRLIHQCPYSFLPLPLLFWWTSPHPLSFSLFFLSFSSPSLSSPQIHSS